MRKTPYRNSHPGLLSSNQQDLLSPSVGLDDATNASQQPCPQNQTSTGADRTSRSDVEKKTSDLAIPLNGIKASPGIETKSASSTDRQTHGTEHDDEIPPFGARKTRKHAQIWRTWKKIWPALLVFLPLGNLWVLERWKAEVAGQLVEKEKAQAKAQRQADENQAFEWLLPLIKRATGSHRTDLLDVLMHLAPSTFGRLAAYGIPNAKSKSEATQFQRLQNESKDREAEFDFEIDLAAAWHYSDLRLAGQAARTFHDLVPDIPASQRSNVDILSVQSAEVAFAKGQFDLALHRFEQAFKNVSSKAR